MTEKREPVKHRSVSQVLQYERCAYSYKLGRIDRVWERPAAWFPQGTGVHKAAEEIERSDRTMTLEKAKEVFRDEYSAEVTRYAEKTPNFEYWFASGPYRGEADIERRFVRGQEHVERYMKYTEKNPKPDVLEGKLAVELGFETEFGGVPVRGFIDNVTELEPVDVKSGNKPGDPFQLETYAGVLQKLYDITPTVGFFMMTKTGKATYPYDVSHVSEDYLADRYGEVDQKIKAGEFEPDPEPSKCRFCTVSSSCPFSMA